MPFVAIQMDLEIIILTKSERERQIPYDITYMWNLKYGTKEPMYKTETDSQTQRSDLWLCVGGQWGGGGGMDWEFGVVDANQYIQNA